MVCTGNICRSAMAHVMLSQYAAKHGIPVRVDSCGVSDEERGNPIDSRAVRVLRRNDYDIPAHRARQIELADLRDFDLILVMTSGHYGAVERLIDHAGMKRDEVDLRMFRSFEPEVYSGQVQPGHRRDLDVPDPWYGGPKDFDETFETIERCLPQIVEAISAK